MTSPPAPPSRQSWASRALNWFGNSSPDAHANEAASLSADGLPLNEGGPAHPLSSGGPPGPQGGSHLHATQPSLSLKSPQSLEGPPHDASRGLWGGPSRGASHQGAPPPAKSTVTVGGRKALGGSSGGGGAACMDMKNIHKFVIDLNKRAAAKQQGQPLPPLNPHAMDNRDDKTKGILAFNGLPPYDSASSVAESPSMGF
ncbi:hypothetical protein ACSSS7_003116 [Eimeria intestinalis]